MAAQNAATSADSRSARRRQVSAARAPSVTSHSLAGFRIAHAIVARRIIAAPFAVAQYVDDFDLVPRAQQAAQRLFVVAGGHEEIGNHDYGAGRPPLSSRRPTASAICVAPPGRTALTNARKPG